MHGITQWKNEAKIEVIEEIYVFQFPLLPLPLPLLCFLNKFKREACLVALTCYFYYLLIILCVSYAIQRPCPNLCNSVITFTQDIFDCKPLQSSPFHVCSSQIGAQICSRFIASAAACQALAIASDSLVEHNGRDAEGK